MAQTVEEILDEAETVPDWDVRKLYREVAELSNRQQELSDQQRERLKMLTERFRTLAYKSMGS